MWESLTYLLIWVVDIDIDVDIDVDDDAAVVGMIADAELDM